MADQEPLPIIDLVAMFASRPTFNCGSSGRRLAGDEAGITPIVIRIKRTLKRAEAADAALRQLEALIRNPFHFRGSKLEEANRFSKPVSRITKRFLSGSPARVGKSTILTPHSGCRCSDAGISPASTRPRETNHHRSPAGTTMGKTSHCGLPVPGVR